MSQRLNYIDVVLWLLRIGIIGIVLWGTFAKLFLGVGNTYSVENWIDFFISGLSVYQVITYINQ